MTFREPSGNFGYRASTPVRREGRPAVISAVIGAVVLALWFVTSVIPEWQYKNRPPGSDFQEGNIAMALVSLLLLATVASSMLATIGLSFVALLKRAFAPAAVALGILALTVVGCIVGINLM